MTILSNPRFKKPRKRNGFNNNVFVYDFGCRFRSKFEWKIARWLNKYNIKWEFEPKVRLGDSFVLPDFYLSDYKMFLELRPEKLIDEKLLKKIRLLKETYQKECVLITDIDGAKTCFSRLNEKREPSRPGVVWVFSGKRGELKENKPCHRP